MGPFDFTHALLRTPARSVSEGLRDGGHDGPSYEGVLQEHRAYEVALRELGVEVEVLPALEAYPDSIFVEDPALVFGDGANLLRVKGHVLLGEAFPRTREIVEMHGVPTIAMPIAEIGKIDAGLSCMSLRWQAR